MTEIPAASVSRRPPLAFRVGVTGARALAPEIADRLRPAVAEILGLVAGQMTKLADDPVAKPVYSAAAAGAAPFTLRLLSPLAEGSDRLVAEEALKAGYALYAPLPFSQTEYENDFKQSVGAFRALLVQAEVLELDGGRAIANESYREVGRFVVRNCDLLIAIWDGDLERGVGGTAEIVRFAVSARVPVWWIDANGVNAPKFIDEPFKLRKPSLAASGDSAGKGVVQYLETTILPPRFADPEHSGVFGSIAHLLGRLFVHDGSPLTDYLAEKPLASSFLWHAYARLMEMVLPKSGESQPSAGAAPAGIEHSRLERWWEELYKSADTFSIGYGDRYRSSYVLIAALAFTAVAAAALGSALPSGLELVIGGIEIFALAGIAALVLANQVYHWHEKWISYRLLAELCRKQCVLSVIGRSLPTSEVIQMALDAVEEKENEEAVREKLPREAWVAWYFTAASRAAPFLTGTFIEANAHALAVTQSLVNEQTAYHQARRARNKAASRRIGQFGEICFLITAVAGVCKIYYLFLSGIHLSAITWTTVLGACFSAASGAFVGVRAYSEFPLLVQQSTHMLRIMKETKIQLDAVELGQPLASRDLGHTMQELAISMMQDVSGWMQLFRIKALEAA
jgi:hypothetical protein